MIEDNFHSCPVLHPPVHPAYSLAPHPARSPAPYSERAPVPYPVRSSASHLAHSPAPHLARPSGPHHAQVPAPSYARPPMHPPTTSSAASSSYGYDYEEYYARYCRDSSNGGYPRDNGEFKYKERGLSAGTHNSVYAMLECVRRALKRCLQLLCITCPVATLPCALDPLIQTIPRISMLCRRRDYAAPSVLRWYWLCIYRASTIYYEHPGTILWSIARDHGLQIISLRAEPCFEV